MIKALLIVTALSSGGFDYKTEMSAIKEELKELNAEANDLAGQIQINLDELGL